MLSASQPHRFRFIGAGNAAALATRLHDINPWNSVIGPWRRHHGDPGVDDDQRYPNHPANYLARGELVDAVNTALALQKPLLLTGNPGTGKSQLAERIAWEFNLSPVLRFEAQSLSEATDLFYRFDLVGHLAAVEMVKLAERREAKGQFTDELLTQTRSGNPLGAERFVKLGPLGEAIVRSNPQFYPQRVLFDAVFGTEGSAHHAVSRPSVVLIDEIDKASRDFPNDLLNGIERLEFRIRELGLETMMVDERHRPIVIITSNSERDLPAPFLRRCTFFHIEDPSQDELRRIVAQRFFAPSGSNPPGANRGEPRMPAFYDQLLHAFWNFRDRHANELHYRPGTSELIDWTSAIRSDRGDESSGSLAAHVDLVRRTASSVSKHKDDQQVLQTFLDGFFAGHGARAHETSQ